MYRLDIYSGASLLRTLYMNIPERERERVNHEANSKPSRSCREWFSSVQGGICALEKSLHSLHTIIKGSPTLLLTSELRSCVKVEVDVLGSRHP